jgi:hypothetical protein
MLGIYPYLYKKEVNLFCFDQVTLGTQSYKTSSDVHRPGFKVAALLGTRVTAECQPMATCGVCSPLWTREAGDAKVLPAKTNMEHTDGPGGVCTVNNHAFQECLMIERNVP